MTDGDLARVRLLLEASARYDSLAAAARKRLWSHWAPLLYDEVVALRKMLASRASRALPRRASNVKHEVLRRDHGRCRYCGAVVAREQRTFDHVVPKSQGGTRTPGNTVLACAACNQRKGGRTPDEADMPLLPAGGGG